MNLNARFLDDAEQTDPCVPEHTINPFAERGIVRSRVLIEKDNEPVRVLRIFVGTDEDGFLLEQCFSTLLVNQETLAILYGQHVHLFDMASHRVVSHFLNDYVCAIYPVPDPFSPQLSESFLATTFCYTFLISIRQGVIWRSAQCAIDGVIISEIAGNVIYGSGEWDPPGGWLPFMLSLETGKLIKEA